MSVRQLYSLTLAALLGSLLASSGAAAVFERDLVPGSGDGLLTFDDVNNRVWLDLPYIITEFPTESRGTDERYQAVLQQLEPGGSLDGFLVANSDDLIALAVSAGIDVSTTSLEVNEQQTVSLIDLLGGTDTDLGTRGLLREFSDTPSGPSQLIGLFAVARNNQFAGVRIFPGIENSDDIPSRITSVMLYRQVPEPSSALLALLAVCYSLVIRSGSTEEGRP